MSVIGIQSNLLCASEFSLAIALTVFIIITVVLSILLIALAASKSFRTVFFHDKPQKKKSTKKSSSAPAQSEPESVDTVPIDPPKPRRVTTRRKEAEPEYLNAIPTVPLNGIIAPPPPKPRAGRRATADDAVEAMKVQEAGSTYTTRSITITRARSSARPVAQETKTEKPKSGTDRTSKKR